MHCVSWKTAEAAQSTAQSSEATLMGKRKEFLPVVWKVQPNEVSKG
jgi:hypothetical protein